MMVNETEKVRDFFHGYAGDFDAIYGHTAKRNFIGRWVDRNLRKVMRLRFEETIKNTSNNAINSILDIGCGPGRYCVEFVRQGKKVVGVDLAEGMLALARQAVSAVVLPGTISFIKSDYLEAQFTERFDGACLMGFFDYIEDPVPIFKKLKKEISKEIYASFPKNQGLLAKIRMIRYRLRNCPLYLYSQADVERILKDSGLENQYEIKDLGRDYYVKVDLS